MSSAAADASSFECGRSRLGRGNAATVAVCRGAHDDGASRPCVQGESSSTKDLNVVRMGAHGKDTLGEHGLSHGTRPL